MRIKEPKIIKKITDNFGIALLAGIFLMLISRYIMGPQENLIGITLGAMIEIAGIYLPISALFKWNRRIKEKKALDKNK